MKKKREQIKQLAVVVQSFVLIIILCLLRLVFNSNLSLSSQMVIISLICFSLSLGLLLSLNTIIITVSLIHSIKVGTWCLRALLFAQLGISRFFFPLNSTFSPIQAKTAFDTLSIISVLSFPVFIWFGFTVKLWIPTEEFDSCFEGHHNLGVSQTGLCLNLLPLINPPKLLLLWS